MAQKGNSHEFSKPQMIWKCSKLACTSRVLTLSFNIRLKTCDHRISGSKMSKMFQQGWEYSQEAYKPLPNRKIDPIYTVKWPIRIFEALVIFCSSTGHLVWYICLKMAAKDTVYSRAQLEKILQGSDITILLLKPTVFKVYGGS